MAKVCCLRKEFFWVCIPFITVKCLGGRVWDHIYSLQNVRFNLYDGCSTFFETVGLDYQLGIEINYLNWWDEDLQDNIAVPWGERAVTLRFYSIKHLGIYWKTSWYCWRINCVRKTKRDFIKWLVKSMERHSNYDYDNLDVLFQGVLIHIFRR